MPLRLILHVRIVLEVIGGLAHDVLNPWRKHRILIAHGNKEEDARTQHIVEVIGNEGCNELILLVGETHCLLVELRRNHLHITTIHDSLIVLMNQLTLLILQLLILLEEPEELVVERRTTHHLLGIIKLHRDATTLQDQRCSGRACAQ